MHSNRHRNVAQQHNKSRPTTSIVTTKRKGETESEQHTMPEINHNFASQRIKREKVTENRDPHPVSSASEKAFTAWQRPGAAIPRAATRAPRQTALRAQQRCAWCAQTPCKKQTRKTLFGMRHSAHGGTATDQTIVTARRCNAEEPSAIQDRGTQQCRREGNQHHSTQPKVEPCRNPLRMGTATGRTSTRGK